MPTEKIKCAIVMGAGASFDACPANRPRNDEWRPPLAVDLFGFDSGKRGGFQGVLQKHAEQIGTIASALALTSAKGALDIERELRRYAEHGNPELKAAFTFVPFYLRHLLWRVSMDYGHPHTHVSFATRLLLEEPQHDVCFLVLNYDILLEKALESIGHPKVADINDYLTDSTRLIKLHGSVDWLRPIGTFHPPNPERWRECVAREWSSAPSSIEVERTGTIQVQNRGYNTLWGMVPTSAPDGQFGYPVLTAPLAGKGEEAFVCPDSHIRAARDFLAEARKVLVIGTSGLDDDLLALLNGSLTNDVVAVHYVGSRDVESVAERFASKVGALTTAPEWTFSEGFQAYVTSRAFERFLQLKP